MVDLPSSGKGVTVAAFVLLAVLLLVYAPTLTVWLVMTVVVGVALYVVYLAGRGVHERALGKMRGET